MHGGIGHVCSLAIGPSWLGASTPAYVEATRSPSESSSSECESTTGAGVGREDDGRDGRDALDEIAVAARVERAALSSDSRSMLAAKSSPRLMDCKTPVASEPQVLLISLAPIDNRWQRLWLLWMRLYSSATRLVTLSAGDSCLASDKAIAFSSASRASSIMWESPPTKEGTKQSKLLFSAVAARHNRKALERHQRR